jgi:hypothetical protein
MLHRRGTDLIRSVARLTLAHTTQQAVYDCDRRAPRSRSPPPSNERASDRLADQPQALLSSPPRETFRFLEPAPELASHARDEELVDLRERGSRWSLFACGTGRLEGVRIGRNLSRACP